MNNFKCKMCGGTIEFNPGDKFGICDSCGTKQAIPSASQEIISDIFDRIDNITVNSGNKAEQSTDGKKLGEVITDIKSGINDITYARAERALKNAKTEESFRGAALIYGSLGDYLDAVEKQKTCLSRADECHSKAVYAEASFIMNDNSFFTKGKRNYIRAAELFETIRTYSDAEQKAAECRRLSETSRRSVVEIITDKRFIISAAVVVGILIILAVIL